MQIKEMLRYKEIDYVIRYPENFTPDKKYPLIFYIHGAGGRGRDINVIYNHPFFIETQEHNLNMISVAPQCYEDSWFSIMEQLHEFILFAIKQPFIDADKVYLMGASMGGYTTWQLAMSWPELFAAIVPICGGGMYWNAGRLKNLGVWAFHGSDDPTVFCEESNKMVNAVVKKGGDAKLTIYEGGMHNSWTETFRNINVFEWLLSHSRKTLSVSRSEHDNVKEFG